MASIAVLRTVLFLRILSLLTLGASAVLTGLNNYEDDDIDLVAYRYVIAIGAIGFLYTLIQTAFAIYNLEQEKRWIRNGCLQEFDFFGDKVIALLLATGVGVGFGVTFEYKRAFGDILGDEAKKYLDKGNISTGLLLAGVVFMAILTVFSSNRRRSSSAKMNFFKHQKSDNYAPHFVIRLAAFSATEWLTNSS